MTRTRSILIAAAAIACLLFVRHLWFSRSFDRHIQIAKSGQVCVDAIFAFKVQNGRYPASLQELVPAFLHEAPANDAIKGWDYSVGTMDNAKAGFLLSKHGVLPHAYVQYVSAEIAPPGSVGWVENLEGRKTKLEIESGKPSE